MLSWARASEGLIGVLNLRSRNKFRATEWARASVWLNFALVLAFVLALAPSGLAQDNARVLLNTPTETGSIATPQLVAWLTAMVHDNLPPIYEDDRKWGQQKEVWDGVKLWREDGHFETKRRTKLVNAGTWTRYSMAVVDPDKNLHVAFNRLETLPDSRIAFEVVVECPLDVFGRMSQWARDVQIVSISANADAACRLTIDGTVQFQMNVLKLPPDIIIKPHIDHAHIALTHYRVRRISQVGGDVAKVLGNGLRGVVDDKLEDMNAKLADKINKQFDKNSQRLSFSTQDWLRSKLPLPAN